MIVVSFIIFIITIIIIILYFFVVYQIEIERKYIHYMNSNVYFYYKSNKNIKCVIHNIEYKGFFPKNPKITLWVTYEDNTQSNLITTKYDFERLWSIST
jgi:cell division protein YceG involved in septum cleavage